MARTFRVGLTGGIASGKSTVAQLFAALGVPVIDADVISRQVVAPGSPLLSQIAARFGAQILQSDGSLDRKALRAKVFSDSAARADLEGLTHPVIWEAIERQSANSDGPYQLLAVPLLIEKHRDSSVDRVLVVDCDEALQIRRLQARDGTSLAEARKMLESQAPRAERLAAADDLIANSSGMAELRDQVERLHARYLKLVGTPRR